MNLTHQEINDRCELWKHEDRWYIDRHKVDVRMKESNTAVVSWHQGGIVPMNYDSIKVKRFPFTCFGLLKVKSFEDRLQDAIAEMQRRCDEYDSLELEEKDLNESIKKLIR